ncbi:NEL-type E3 ubiquitin ligase domain-containing protein [Xanthomonas arboricola]|uniref:NEL-type E3 ubiquitin ligase domain-containing protein n=1 Tax=Xanthomonas arboricola TaxID=56448 RepID=UPI000E0EBC94|nr:NEL-type E3 ubiquitin ligase domain-containing protein [Xanthomonas arboricola]
MSRLPTSSLSSAPSTSRVPVDDPAYQQHAAEPASSPQSETPAHVGAGPLAGLSSRPGSPSRSRAQSSSPVHGHTAGTAGAAAPSSSSAEVVDIVAWADSMRALQIHEDLQMVGAYESSPRALGERIDHWLTDACQPCLENPHAFDTEFNAGQFSELLNKRYEATANQSEIEKGEVLQLGAEVINAVAADPELRELVFAMAESALGTCDDNVSTGFSAIVNTVRNHQLSLAVKQGRLDAAGLQAWAGQQFRLYTLESEVHRFIHQSIEACKTELEQYSSDPTEVQRQACLTAIQTSTSILLQHWTQLAPFDSRIGELMARVDQSGDSDPATFEQEVGQVCSDIVAMYQSGQIEPIPGDPMSQNLFQWMQYLDQNSQDYHRLPPVSEEQVLRRAELMNKLNMLADEPVETMMHAKVMLREELDLPNMPSSMIFNIVSVLTTADFEALASSVRASERDKDTLGDFLLANETWRAGVKQLYADEYEALMKSFENDPFWSAEPGPGDDAHVAQMVRYNELAADYQNRTNAAENAWLRKKVRSDVPG